MVEAPTQYQGLRAEEQRPNLSVPHSGGELTFLHPPYGPSTYANVGLSIEHDQLRRPTMAETASLVHAAFNSPKYNRYRKEIEAIMREKGLWAFTGTLYVPKEGAFIQDDPEIRDGMPFMDRESLEQRLNAKDPSVRFVPFGYEIGRMTSSQLAQNAYIIALAGEEGAEKLARIADKYELNPHLESFRSVETPQTRVSALDFWGLSLWLGVDSYLHGNVRVGRAFGVFEKTGGASRAKK